MPNEREFHEAFEKKAAECREKGFREPNTTDYGMGYSDGYAAGYASAQHPPAPAVEKPKVVCFCGSTRFTAHMLILRWEMEKQGIITMGWNVLPDGYGAESHQAEAEGVKEIIDELHKRKIDISDEVFIVNLDGYIGESTRSERDYAISIGKPVKYLEHR